MTEYLFYHLELTRLEAVLPPLLEKCLAKHWRSLVLCREREDAGRLDQLLWTYTDDSFLPHGLYEAGTDQPVTLHTHVPAELSPDILFVTGGADIPEELPDGLVRLILIFDGVNEDALHMAREFWKRLAGGGQTATYWRQDEQGRWREQARSA